jgi:hypothetical protein
MPKCFRTPRLAAQATSKSNFIATTVALLDEVTPASLADHNIPITYICYGIQTFIYAERG